MKKHYHVSYIECEGTQYAHPVSFIVRSAKTASSQRKSAKVTECTCAEAQYEEPETLPVLYGPSSGFCYDHNSLGCCT